MTIRIVGGTRGVYEDDDGQDVAGVRVVQVDLSEAANSTGTKVIVSLIAFCLLFGACRIDASQRPTHCAWQGCAFFAIDCVCRGVPFKVSRCLEVATPGIRYGVLVGHPASPVLLLAWLLVRGVAETSSIPSALACHRCVVFGVVGSRPLRPLLALVCPLLCRNPCEGRLVCGVGKPLSFASWRCSLCRPMGCLIMGR